ncbi:MAG TPA: hypothetical protein VFO66_02015 [Gemmatimonadaceae bacterium]|nr:hypothetical protein [Gemmatimonadaceae bacterium]
MTSGPAGDGADAQDRVWVVVDTKGAGRVVGVFESEAQAAEIVAINPSYYRVTQLRLNEINPECVRWVQDEQGRSRLERMSTQLRAIDDGDAE